jgi:PKD repeat protein
MSSYTFNFGDGTGLGPTTSPIASHTFAATGGYIVRLTVTDRYGRTGTTTVSVPVITVSDSGTDVLSAGSEDGDNGNLRWRRVEYTAAGDD